MIYKGENHTFVVCAYKENQNLEECIKSLLKQSVKSNIIVSTSTPNLHIQSICEKYQLQQYINPSPSIAKDWNYGYMQAKTELITIAHQDDIYTENYTEEIIKYANKRKDIIFLYTDYFEIKNGKKEIKNRLLKIKRIMNFPLRFSIFWRNRFVRRRTLSLGNPICCPSVTFVKKNAGDNVFDTKYLNSCDYITWSILSRKKGSIIYIPKMLMAHRIYEGSTTTLNIKENIRGNEDLEILCSYWPKWIAKIIYKFYSKSMDSNEV